MERTQQAATTGNPRPGSILQRACACGRHSGNGGECAECRKKRLGLQRRSVGRGPDVAPPIVHDVLRSPGRPLDEGTRGFMESRFGQDFSGVRVHTDGRAAESARAVSALAYTVGNHVAFDAGQYAPTTRAGRGLLAHELAHTRQQLPATQTRTGPITLFDVTPAGRNAEAEADRLAAGVLTKPVGRPGTVQKYSFGMQRQTFRSPDVQVRSPVFEETVTQLSDIAGAGLGRPLTRGEQALALGVFGRSIDYSRVRLITVDELQYRTVANNIYIPHDFTINNESHAQTLIHELTHVWQYQHGGTSYISVALGTQIAATISHGSRNFAYDYRISAGQSFFDFTPEQQGLLVENYFAMRRDQIAIQATSGGAYWSNHFDRTGFRAGLSAANRLAEINRELPLHQPLIRQMRAALPRPEADLLLQRASEVMTIPGQQLAPLPPERQIAPIRPLFEIRF